MKCCTFFYRPNMFTYRGAIQNAFIMSLSKLTYFLQRNVNYTLSSAAENYLDLLRVKSSCRSQWLGRNCSGDIKVNWPSCYVQQLRIIRTFEGKNRKNFRAQLLLKSEIPVRFLVPRTNYTWCLGLDREQLLLMLILDSEEQIFCILI